MIKKISTNIDGLYVLQNISHSDNRGIFRELWNKNNMHNLELNNSFDQDNMSISSKNVIRGLHYQTKPHEQLKYIQVLHGKILDVAVDLRKESNTFGEYFSIEISDKNSMGLWIPKGFAHGFLALEEKTIVVYKCSGKYKKNYEKTIKWNDPQLNIKWGINSPKVSIKDSKGISFESFQKIKN